jgi:hypothetical protein
MTSPKHSPTRICVKPAFSAAPQRVAKTIAAALSLMLADALPHCAIF